MADTVKSFEEMKESLLKAIAGVKWIPLQVRSKCPQCNSSEMERTFMLMGGPWSGHVRCKSCGHTETVCSYLGHNMFKVESL